MAGRDGLAEFFHRALAVGEEVARAPIEDGDLRRAVQGGLDADGGGGAAGAQHHETLALDLDAVLVEVADEAHAVGIVAGELAVLAHGDGVADADELGGGRQCVEIGSHGGLIRHGDVEAADAQGLQGLDGLLGLLQGDVEGQVRGIDAGALETIVIHGRGAGVAHRGADEAKELGVTGNSAFHLHILFFTFPALPARPGPGQRG